MNPDQPNTQPQGESVIGGFEMVSLHRLDAQENNSLRGSAPLSVPLHDARSDKVSHFVRRPPVLAGIVIITSLLAFLVGNKVHVFSPDASTCINGASSGSISDTVAPEGPVSSDFDALYDYRGHPRSIKRSHGVVSADHGRCSDIGLTILQTGGNAVDAAIATALCQGVYNPMASGIGGGMFMLIRLPNGSAEVIDAREVAPLGANETMFLGHPELSVSGGLAAGVPLELRGLELAHARYGTVPWRSLVLPAAEIAARGFPAHPYLVSALEAANFEEYPALQSTFLIKDKRSSSWRAPQINETCCRRSKLAQLLQDVASGGADQLYNGKYTDGLVADIRTEGGIITTADLSAAQATIKEVLRARVMGVDLLAAPPPSSAAAIITALRVLEGYKLPLAGSGVVGVHRMIEAMKHAFALRMSLGDPGPDPAAPFVPDLAEVLSDIDSPEFAESLRNMLQDDSVLNITEYGGKWNVMRSGTLPEDHGTSHINVVDANRMAVALTTTVNSGFGSKVLSPSTGILLNNQMDDFSTPGHPNIYGIPPSPSNFIRPGKKPFSSMSPIVVERDGELRMVLGASGGPRIISAVLQTLVRVLAYGEDAFSAVAGPRVHHQLVPEAMYAENWAAGGAAFTYDNATLEGLAARGHSIVPSAWGAVVQAVIADADAGLGEEFSALTAVSDPRKDGAPSGY